MERPPDFDDLLAAHGEMHAVDGSIPLTDPDRQVDS
jgi:hypothetical protein